MKPGAPLPPWDEYWTEADPKGCVPNGGVVGQVQTAFWSDVLRRVPQRAKVLDLGTGSGAALKMLQALRADLSLAGVDAARVLPPNPPGIELRAAVSIDKLPFPDASKGLIISQFGIEYAGSKALREAARVLQKNGTAAFCLHRAGGAICQQNSVRRDAIHWALAESGLAGLTSKPESAGALAKTFDLQSYKARAKVSCRAPGAAIEIGTAIGAVLQQAPGTSETHRRLLHIGNLATEESARIAEMLAAALDRSALQNFCESLAAHGVALQAVGELAISADAPPFAYIYIGQKTT